MMNLEFEYNKTQGVIDLVLNNHVCISRIDINALTCISETINFNYMAEEMAMTFDMDHGEFIENINWFTPIMMNTKLTKHQELLDLAGTRFFEIVKDALPKNKIIKQMDDVCIIYDINKKPLLSQLLTDKGIETDVSDLNELVIQDNAVAFLTGNNSFVDLNDFTTEEIIFITYII